MVQKFTNPSSMQVGKSLARKLIPVADKLRDLFTKFGMRPYRVRIVRVRWSGERRGVGVPLVEATLDLMPTPLVQDLTTLTEIVQAVGLDEVGSIILSEVSGSFTDDQLRFVDKTGQPQDPNEEVFYEIEFPRPDGLPGARRRFYLRSAPHYNAGRFQWQMRLEKAHENRSRTGDYQ